LSSSNFSPVDPCLSAGDLREQGVRARVGTGPLVVEIGFGRAEVLVEMGRASPSLTFLGVEVSRKRVQKAARRVSRAEVGNVWLVHATAEYVLERVLPDASVVECWINFPDPWPKKRHHKRRLIRPAVVMELARVLRPGALLHVATDHSDYARWIADVTDRAEGFVNLHSPRPWSSESPSRPQTGYEAEFLAEGRTIAYLDYRRTE
jgi:tRNA (guanine-N7-)-methyltransferase